MHRQLPGRVLNQLQQRRVKAPGGLHLVAAGIEGGIAEHGVGQQPHIALVGWLAEAVVVGKGHVNGAAAHARARSLHFKAEFSPLIGLNAQDQLVDGGGAAGGIEQVHRCLPKGEHHLADPLWQPLAGAQIEGHPLPAPVVDEQLHRHVGFSGAVGIDARLLAISGCWRDPRSSRAVLAAHAAFPRFLLVGQAGGLEQLGLLVAHRFRVEAARRLHGG